MMVLSALNTDVIDYITHSPENVWSGSLRAFHKLYKKYIQISRDEFHNQQIGELNQDLLIEKRNLMRKIFKLKRMINVSPHREAYRNTNEYRVLRRLKISKKLSKF